jgi:hypothetical protein
MKQKTLGSSEGVRRTKSVYKGFYIFIIKPIKTFVNMGRPKPKTASWDEIKKYGAITTIAITAFLIVLFGTISAFKWVY